MTDEGAKASKETEPTAETDKAVEPPAPATQADETDTPAPSHSRTDGSGHERTSPWYRRVEIVTAFIALVGVVLAGGVGACSSYVTTTATMEGQRKLAREGFGRDHREKAYDELLAQLSALDSTYREIIFEVVQAFANAGATPAFSGSVELPPPLRDSIRAQFGDRWTSAQKQFGSAISGVELVASHRVISVAAALSSAYSLSYLKLTFGGPGFANLSQAFDELDEVNSTGLGDPLGVDLRPVPVEPALTTKSIAELRTLLVQYAKDDLGLTD